MLRVPVRVIRSAAFAGSGADLAGVYREWLDGPIQELKKRRLGRAQEPGQLDPDSDLDLAVDLVFSPIAQRRLGDLGVDGARAVGRHALRGPAVRCRWPTRVAVTRCSQSCYVSHQEILPDA
ncbi:TetR-like C-terminal domain-containing protein [Promicromonospora sp. NPDC057488]|uniref:TetR-like C-terminal domain-containing protein n=1 Tax=Promicromonospora sp. NPDC057488 TaxID=3346147 RepID=UPI00367083CE